MHLPRHLSRHKVSDSLQSVKKEEDTSPFPRISCIFWQILFVSGLTPKQMSHPLADTHNDPKAIVLDELFNIPSIQNQAEGIYNAHIEESSTINYIIF